MKRAKKHRLPQPPAVRDPVARSPLLRKGGAHGKSIGAKAIRGLRQTREHGRLAERKIARPLAEIGLRRSLDAAKVAPIWSEIQIVFENPVLVAKVLELQRPKHFDAL